MQLAWLLAQNSSLSDLRHCALSYIPTVSRGLVSFKEHPCSSACSYIQVDVIGFAASKTAGATFSSHSLFASAHSKIIRYEGEKGRGEQFSLFTEDLQKNMLSLDSSN